MGGLQGGVALCGRLPMVTGEWDCIYTNQTYYLYTRRLPPTRILRKCIQKPSNVHRNHISIYSVLDEGGTRGGVTHVNVPPPEFLFRGFLQCLKGVCYNRLGDPPYSGFEQNYRMIIHSKKIHSLKGDSSNSLNYIYICNCL